MHLRTSVPIAWRRNYDGHLMIMNLRFFVRSAGGDAQSHVDASSFAISLFKIFLWVLLLKGPQQLDDMQRRCSHSID